MNCQDNPHLIHAYSDGELDPLRCLEVEQHLRTCAACAQQYRALQALRAGLRQEGLYHTVPEGLRRQIQDSLQHVAPAAASAPASRARWSSLLAFGAGIAATFAILSVGPFIKQRPGTDPLVADLAAGHVRSLMAGHLMDVPSSNQHTVKPWFEGRLDFSPPVKDLAASGFPLAGGRLDYIGGRPVAALAYQCRQHVINLFLWPAAAGAKEEIATQEYHGFHVLSWAQGGMTCHAVSDLNTADLTSFARAFQKD